MQDIFLFIQHQQLLMTALVCVLMLLALLELVRQKRGGARVEPHVAVRMINHQNAVLLDVRSGPAFTSGHIVGAVSLPLEDLDSKYKKLEKFKAQPILLICAAGLDSPKAALILKKHGFNVTLIAGGLRSWTAAELPLVKGQ